MHLYIQCTGTGSCKKTCASDELDCYLLDNNGFVLLSERSEHTGLFFGKIDGTIMDSLVQDRIYRRIALTDYQGICSDRDNPYSAASQRISPFQPMTWVFKYAITLATSWFSFFPLPVISWPQAYNTYEDTDNVDQIDDYYDSEDYLPGDTQQEFEQNIPTPEVERAPIPTAPPRVTATITGPRVVPDPAHARPCDLKTDLYILQPDRLNSSGQNNPLKVISIRNNKKYTHIQILINF